MCLPRQAHYLGYTKSKKIKITHKLDFSFLESLKRMICFDQLAGTLIGQASSFQIQCLMTSLQWVIWHRNMFSFILLFETGGFNYWPKREFGLQFLSHLYCVPLTLVVWERKRKIVLYGINAWFQFKYFSSHIYLFGMSFKCGLFFFQTNPIGCPIAIIHKLPAYTFCFNLLFRHRPCRWQAIFLTHYYFCGFEVSG